MAAKHDDRHEFTLLVPTYNRADELARLLAYLQRHAVRFQVIVLDSSERLCQETNQAHVAATGLNIEWMSFDPNIPPWEKFMRGADLVGTEYCALCADDDVVLPESIGAMIEFLHQHGDYSAAHGWYFTFSMSRDLDIRGNAYRGASLDEKEPLRRLHRFLRNYEAVTYAVHRTSVMQAALRKAQDLESMLGKELLAGALTVASGKLARLPILYYGRSLSLSQAYEHWHPLEFLVSDPQRLYREYGRYRSILSSTLASGSNGGLDPGEIRHMIDLLHIRYLADYVDPQVMDYLIESSMTGASQADIRRGMWSLLTARGARRATDASWRRALARRLRANRLLKNLRDRYAPSLQIHHAAALAGIGARSVRSRTASGSFRRYYFHNAFLVTLPAGSSRNEQIACLLRALDKYD